MTEESIEKEGVRPLYDLNQERAQALKQPWQLYYYAVKGYVITEVEMQAPVDQMLSELLDRLEKAQRLEQAPKEALGKHPHAYARQELRHLDVPRYVENFSRYAYYLLIYLVITYGLFALFQFGYGIYYYGDLNSAWNMPVPISLLGLPLQFLMLATSVFFLFKFIRQSACGHLWQKRHHIMYLLAAILSALAFLVIPFFSLAYHVLIIRIPVFLLALCLVLAAGYHFSSRHLHIDQHIDRLFEDQVRKAKQKAIEQNMDIRLADKLPNKWATLKLKRPLINRSTVKKAKEEQKEDK
ncbi:hypothetical protein ACX3VT_00855 [Aerococcus sanguinicola]|uniref:hypothetical protein n=1 Tax=unclassified Aerococcus TaxID=2618060 RepID=UPI0008A1A3A3|nr:MULTISPECIES: hypothetical protein [unclassified Aerococcus]KAB0646254.1 hypothetical protein F6I01_08115 [Aerococcus sanguinicola]MDK6234052.1 hypothetical protein [Aerococcus sp. UMB10185]MDK6804780.1 hypothetical protein [Aerococcus sp. UMB7834]MDK6856595.1 hypothetical protein [Aerococcus sp. UMB7533]OFN01121.1 hypothetical protein HMPREF2626_03040 [Aerococcus sp. HMSC062A02]